MMLMLKLLLGITEERMMVGLLRTMRTMRTMRTIRRHSVRQSPGPFRGPPG